MYCIFLQYFAALGLTCEMRSGVGPVFPSPIETPEDIHTKLKSPSAALEELQYVYDAINLTRHQVKILIQPMQNFRYALFS